MVPTSLIICYGQLCHGDRRAVHCVIPRTVPQERDVDIVVCFVFQCKALANDLALNRIVY